MKLRTALMAATIMALPAAAMAQPISGLYVGAGAGGNWQQPIHSAGISGAAGTLPGFTNGISGTQTGFAGVGSIGYGLGNGLRFEVEGDYRYNKLNQFPVYGVHGANQQFGGMGNVLYELDMTSFGIPWMSPYLGVGVGYEQEKLDTLRLYSAGKTGVTFLSKDGSEGGFAYQGIAGVAFPIPAVPGLALTAEYRFLGVGENLSYKGTVAVPAGAFAGVPAGSYNAKLKTTTEYNQSALLGLRYAFNAAPPPPPPAQAPVIAPVAASRTYLVFFDWDRADLTARAKQIVKEAADASTHTQYTKIQVNGYTDLSGTAAYNQRLSVRRAQAVAAELVRDGVPRAAINIQGFGESNPLVPTAKGVREPQNRRVEIIIQ